MDDLEVDLERLRQEYEAGDRGAVLQALKLCFLREEFVPYWVRWAFLDAMHDGQGGRLKSWDDVWGHPTTRTQAWRLHRDMLAAPSIPGLIEQARAEGRPINDILFEEIGGKLGMSASSVKVLYKVRHVDLYRRKLTRD